MPRDADAAVEIPKSEVNRTKGKVNFTTDDVQAYYDMKVVGGANPDAAAAMTGQKFGLKVTTSPTGEVQLPASIPKKEYPGQGLLPEPGAEEPEGSAPAPPPKPPAPAKPKAPPQGKDVDELPPDEEPEQKAPSGASNAGAPSQESVALLGETLEDAIADLAAKIADDLIRVAHAVARQKEASFDGRAIESDLRTALREILTDDVEDQIRRRVDRPSSRPLEPRFPDERDVVPALRVMFGPKQDPKYLGFGWQSVQSALKKLARLPWTRHREWASVARYASARAQAPKESLAEAVRKAISAPLVSRQQGRWTVEWDAPVQGAKRGLATTYPTYRPLKRVFKTEPEARAFAKTITVVTESRDSAVTTWIIENPAFNAASFTALVAAHPATPLEDLAQEWWAEEFARLRARDARHGLVPAAVGLYDQIHARMAEVCADPQHATVATLAEYRRQGGVFLTEESWALTRTRARFPTA